MVANVWARSAFVLIAVSGCVSALHGQNPQFDVASVKPTNNTEQTYIVFYPGGRLVAKNFPLGGLVKAAWHLQNDQIDGGPKWIRSEGFDVEARAGGNPSREQLLVMLRSLLMERFKLVVRSEVRELPVYELRVARSDRRLGPSLRRSSPGSCTPSNLASGVLMPTAVPPCGVLYSPSGRWTGQAVSMHALITPLGRLVGRVVLDRTDLSDTFDLDLRWTDLSTLPKSDAAVQSADAPSSLFTALEEQLGLKLQPSRGPVDVLVIESARHPTPN